MKSKFICMLACVATGAAIAAAQTSPTIISATSAGNNGAGPNGIAATTSELLFTQPFCPGQQTRGIYQENLAAGTSTLLFPMPVTGPCVGAGTQGAENYLAISLGLGGFTAGDTFVTGVSTTNSTNDEVFKNGSTKFIDSIPGSKNHTGITFDTAGTFGFNLIVTAQGSVTGYDSTGTATFTFPAPANDILEGATVAPLTYVPCPGCLFVTAVTATDVDGEPVGNGAILFVLPGTPSGAAMNLFSSTPGAEPEGLVFVGNNLSCTLAGPKGVAYSYFVSGYATAADEDDLQSTTGAILAFTPGQLGPFAGQLLVPDEGVPPNGGTISAFSGPGVFTTFSKTGYQLEGSTIISCPSGGTGCPATFGYWKHHPFPPSMFVGGTTSIGCKAYAGTTLLAILNANNSGGNAVTILGHQLIAAIANYDAGGKQTPAATAAIGAAITLLCANNIDMSTSFVKASSTLGQQMTALASTLDSYNE